MCNRLKSVNSKRNIWRFSPHHIHSSPRYVRKYRIVATATTTNWLHHYYQYRSWNVILLLLLLLFETQMLLFSMPSSTSTSISTSSRLPFSLSFYLFTFSIFIFIHSQQLGLPLSEQLIFMYNARARSIVHTRLQNRKFESISSGSDDAERKKDGKIFPLNAHTA